MSHDPVEMIILDRRLPDGSAEEAMPRLKAKAPDAAIELETSPAVTHVHGALSMARSNDPDSATSQ